MDYENKVGGASNGVAQAGALTVEPDARLSAALDSLRASGLRSVPIMDPRSGLVVGRLSQADDAGVVSAAPSVPRLGGMATPLGVYLTDGVRGGGAGFLGLALTGVLFLTIALIAQVITSRLMGAVDSGFASAIAWHPGWAHALGPVDVWVTQAVRSVPVLLVLGFVRALPLSGTHAAEHQVVHCIEQGYPLTPANVQSMPRVHPRCGTNLLVGIFLFVSIFVAVFRTCDGQGFSQADGATLGVIVAAPIALTYWRKVGGFLQFWLATKPANEKQIDSAIHAAREVLMRRNEYRPERPPLVRFLMRIWYMGMPQVMTGYFVTYLAVRLVANIWPAFGQFLEL